MEVNPTLIDIQARLKHIEVQQEKVLSLLLGNGRSGVVEQVGRLDERVNDLETTRTNFADRIWSAVLTAAFILYSIFDRTKGA
jgi:hypothetical protein